MTTKKNLKGGRSLSSREWITRHINDPYVQQAKEYGYRSRAAFKLQQIDDKFAILKGAKRVIDLGAAPGGWLQVLRERAPQATLIGLDLQVIQPLANVNTVVGDMFDEKIIDNIGSEFDVILSDMAASACGNTEIDHLRSMALAEAVVEFATLHLQTNGHLVIKVIRGGEEAELQKTLRTMFTKVKQYKPDASYSSSAEFYFVCLHKKVINQ